MLLLYDKIPFRVPLNSWLLEPNISRYLSQSNDFTQYTTQGSNRKAKVTF